MCDCYAPKCQGPNCNVSIDIHLRDFDTGRDEIEVYCGSHIPKNTNDGVLWRISQGKSHSKIFIRALTKNAQKNWDGNHPNIAEPYQEIRVFGHDCMKDVPTERKVNW
ncbi:MAG: hypothetical protein IMZ64_04045 [Bacteroidetes bacterium]|nr:hypothetical protein [Bacteroidota bacterium]